MRTPDCMEKESSAAIADLLTRWLRAGGAAEDEQLLAELITAHISPVIEGVVRIKLRLSGATGQAEADDLRQEALTELLAELQKCRRQPERHPIGDLRGLAATITYRACYRWLRRQTPQRRALKNRLQYVLTRQAELAMWPDAQGRLTAGLAAWRGRDDKITSAQLRQLAGAENFAARVNTGGSAQLGATLVAVFESLAGPVELEELVGLMAAILRISDKPVGGETGLEVVELAARDDVAWQVEKRIFLERLWAEVQLLPLAQRRALLLNLRDAGGNGCIALFPAVGVATLKQLASALELPLEEFAELWNRLPLDDAGIAALLDLTRQQVINARKAARERLARRLRGFL